MSKEAMKLALEALEKLVRFESDSWELGSCRISGQAIKALREALAEQPAPVQQEPTVSKGAYNRVRDDYNDLLKQSEQDAKDAKEWRAHVNRCKLAGIDLDYQITAPQPAQQEYASFAEWAHDYVQDNLHKLKEKNT
jgi:hypothetical protein